MSIHHLLLDIEGTTCPASYVSETLFPYAMKHLPSFVAENIQNNDIQNIIKAAQHEWTNDNSEASIKLKEIHPSTEGNSFEGVIQYLQHLIRTDQKSTSLKDLQGKIWLEGYQRGDLKAEIFPETAECFRRWAQDNIFISSYSSGSIQAQKLLYKHTDCGDLCSIIHQWFDTHTGSKKRAQSYSTISQQLEVSPRNVLFVSDSSEECDAASESGMLTLFSLRNSNPDQNSNGHRVIRSLHEISNYLQQC